MVPIFTVYQICSWHPYLDGNVNNAICKVSFVNRNWLVLGGQDSFACLYNVQSGQFLHKLEHSSGMWSVDVSDIYWT
jgi:WD40 repeat protein